MKNSTRPIIAAMIMTVIIFVVIILLTVFLNPIMRFLFGASVLENFSDMMLALYISAPVGLICDGALFLLLKNIRNSKVFVKDNVTILTILSVCCFFVGVEYVAFAWRHFSMVFIAFAAVFFGFILLVIKNVFRKAVELREENDFTI